MANLTLGFLGPQSPGEFSFMLHQHPLPKGLEALGVGGPNKTAEGEDQEGKELALCKISPHGLPFADASWS